LRALRASFLLVLVSGCTQLFFHPQRALIDTPDRHGIEYRNVTLQAADGTKLDAWFLPARIAGRGRAKAAVLFLHGNAENISTHFLSVAWMPGEGFNALIFDYRGYGKSEGRPSLAGMQLDIDAAMRYLVSHRDVDPNRIILLGQSLGGALAIAYAARSAYRDHIAAIVIDSSFSDYREITREKLAGIWLTWPLQWLPWLTVDDTYSPAASVAALSPVPLLLIHGDSDSVVPFRHSEKLFELAGNPKALWIVPGAGHTESLANPAIRERLVDYLDHQLDSRGAFRATSSEPAIR
jgi:uncharacterized protein